MTNEEGTREWELAQLNIARLLEPLDSPRLADFVANLDRINALAEASEGFVWRLQDEAGDATGVDHPFEDDTIVNLSVWRDVDALHAFTYRTAHAAIMSRRKEWFHRMGEAWTVLWWVPAGHRPSPAEAAARLEALRRDGPTAAAFSFRHAFEAPGAPAPARRGSGAGTLHFEGQCPAG